MDIVSVSKEIALKQVSTKSYSNSKMRRFYLYRQKDISGVSGKGIVAEGIVFTDGTCAMRWLSDMASTALYNSVEDLIKIHDHKGTKNAGHNSIRFLDDE